MSLPAAVKKTEGLAPPSSRPDNLHKVSVLTQNEKASGRLNDGSTCSNTASDRRLRPKVGRTADDRLTAVLRGRLMARRQPLELVIGVRVPAPQPQAARAGARL